MRRFHLFLLFSILFLFTFSNYALAGSVDVGSSADAQVVEGNSSTNYGSTNYMYVGSGTSYEDERIWVKFDLSGELPEGATITSAKLLLYCWKADGPTTIEATAHASSDDTWTEAGITWDDQPSFTSTPLDSQTLTAGDEDRWFTWDVTSHVQAEYSGNSGDDVVTLVVKAATEDQSSASSYGFDGKEYSSSIAPRLRIEYTGEWPQTNNFKIFHVNDAHSRLVPHDFDFPGQDDFPVLEKAGGAAYLATKMLELKAANPNSLILDAGDVSEGSPLGDLRGNGGALDFFNALDAQLKALSENGRGIDAMVVGNHDVRFESYIANMKAASFPIISMNICEEGTTTPYFDPYTVVTLNNGVKVGILGYTTDESSYLGEETEGLLDVVTAVWDDDDDGTINIKDYVETLRTTEGCDVVVLLSHIGHSRIVSGSDALIEDSGGVDPPEVVVSGHWHTWDEKAWQPAQLNYKTTLVEAASYLQYIGELEVTGDGKYVDATKHAIRCSEITPNAAVTNVIDTLIAEYNAASPTYQLDQVIGYSATDLLLDKDKWWTVSEYPWNATNAVGAWITDAMAWKLNANSITADLAIQTGGSIRRDVPKGAITYTEIYEAYPWQDDEMVQVQMTGQQIWDFIQADYCGTSISDGWKVTAEDGTITKITYNGSDIGLSTTYNVIISDYMVEHEGDISFSDPVYTGYSIRQSVIDYTAQYTEASPMYPNGIEDRYDLDTELAGGFRAVVLFVADSENQPYHEDGFIRLLSATDETLLRRGKYGLSELVNSDGSINKEHQFSETMLYRGHLGFLDGKYQNGDIIEIWGEGGFYQGVPEFVSEEGIVSDGVEINVVGHDESLALPEYMPNFAAFWDEWHENHYVKLYVQKTGDNTVVDSDGETQTIYQADAYDTKTLPGEVGDVLELTGVQTTEEYTSCRFRCHTAVLASDQGVTSYPATSAVDAISSTTMTDSSITLTATASDVGASGNGTVVVTATDDSYVVEGSSSSNKGSYTNMYLQSSASSSYGNERIWVKFDLDGKVPTGATVTSATLSMYQWWTSGQGADMDASAHGSSDNSWDEGSITWDTQPSFESTADDTVTLTQGNAQWYKWSVNTYVQNEVTSGDDIISFVVKPATEDASTTTTYNFDAKEYSSGSYAPSLEVSYEVEDGSEEDVEPVSVAFYYRYSAVGVTWGAWTSIGTDSDSSDAWSISFSYPSGYGYYEFYSVATDADGNVEDAPIKADASVRYVSGSNTAASVTPADSIADGTIGTGENVWLSVAVNDSDNDAVDVCFYAENGTEIGCVENVASGQTASVAWTGLDDATTCGWYAVVNDGTESSTSATWSFTTTNTSPSVDSSSSDPGTTQATLSVTVSDADSSQTLDVYFYDESGTLIGSATGVASGDSASVAWPGLSANTEYSWYVVVDDGIESVESETWTFNTSAGASIPSVPAMDVFGMLATIASLLLAGAVWIRRQQS
ncbi:DNRLRE domain-containing protein [uncultured Desulfosarcina sp.]|uniref:CBM96 family carbohydrate-binding protein n=1 Tax=uncultured Desulfosarcina sp. TaxID=218289 RepID=UPI0029C8A276|nr:DNRLRE domain-containing protein [uncultured Desulfosarcina sp.]